VVARDWHVEVGRRCPLHMAHLVQPNELSLLNDRRRCAPCGRLVAREQGSTLISVVVSPKANRCRFRNSRSTSESEGWLCPHAGTRPAKRAEPPRQELHEALGPGGPRHPWCGWLSTAIGPVEPAPMSRTPRTRTSRTRPGSRPRTSPSRGRGIHRRLPWIGSDRRVRQARARHRTDF
jgi:hypothetical protein